MVTVQFLTFLPEISFTVFSGASSQINMLRIASLDIYPLKNYTKEMPG